MNKPIRYSLKRLLAVQLLAAVLLANVKDAYWQNGPFLQLRTGQLIAAYTENGGWTLALWPSVPYTASYSVHFSIWPIGRK